MQRPAQITHVSSGVRRLFFGRWGGGLNCSLKRVRLDFSHLQEVKSGNALEGVCVYTAGRGLGVCVGGGGQHGV